MPRATTQTCLLALVGGCSHFDATAHTANATGQVALNRRVLVDAMAAEGFVNYENEWWHFSFDVPAPTPFDLPLESW